MSDQPARYGVADNSPEARAYRAVPHNQRPLCDDFVPQPKPAAFWCGRCHWNRPLHADNTIRAAIAAELERHQCQARGS